MLLLYWNDLAINKNDGMNLC